MLFAYNQWSDNLCDSIILMWDISKIYFSPALVSSEVVGSTARIYVFRQVGSQVNMVEHYPTYYWIFPEKTTLGFLYLFQLKT